MNRKTLIRVTVLAVSVAFIIFGILRNEPLAVFRKATQVCLSCMGIG